jgi:uncharacterized protein DUF4242
MPVYMTHRDLPGATLDQLTELQKVMIDTSRRFTADGRPVRFIRSSWVPSESHVMCLFEADNPQVVRDVNESAGIPFVRIVEAVDLMPIL